MGIRVAEHCFSSQEDASTLVVSIELERCRPNSCTQGRVIQWMSSESNKGGDVGVPRALITSCAQLRYCVALL